MGIIHTFAKQFPRTNTVLKSRLFQSTALFMSYRNIDKYITQKVLEMSFYTCMVIQNKNKESKF